MGLLVHTSFETEQGIPISNIYLRISSISVAFVGFSLVTIHCESHINREKRLERKQALFVPGIPSHFTMQSPLGSGWNDMTTLYTHVKERLIELGFETVEDVLEPAPAPAPEPEATV